MHATCSLLHVLTTLRFFAFLTTLRFFVLDQNVPSVIADRTRQNVGLEAGKVDAGNVDAGNVDAGNVDAGAAQTGQHLGLEAVNVDADEENLEDRVEQNRYRHRRSKKKETATESKRLPGPKAAPPEVSISMLTCVWSFGCMLNALLKKQNCRRGIILVLDHADRLISFEARKDSKDRVNFLSQLLLIPRILGLNLSIVVISKSVLLGQSREYLHLRLCRMFENDFFSLTSLLLW
jgi:hypothetical protein